MGQVLQAVLLIALFTADGFLLLTCRGFSDTAAMMALVEGMHQWMFSTLQQEIHYHLCYGRE